MGLVDLKYEESLRRGLGNLLSQIRLELLFYVVGRSASIYHALFILRIMRYTVLGKTFFIPNFMVGMMMIILPVYTFDSMLHIAGCLSIIPEMPP